MAYADFTLGEVIRNFGLTVAHQGDLFGSVPEVDLPPRLGETLARYLPFARDIDSDKIRSALLVAPMLVELKFRHPDRLGLFISLQFTIDAAGLSGRTDYILARNPQQLMLVAPACVVVGAKREDMLVGAPQCLAEMVAAQRFNAAEGSPDGPVYGAVTTGEMWRFLALDAARAAIDGVQYNIHSPRKIFGILTHTALGE